ncbi:hypothetical protein GCM10023194_46300 [Planotetraspora phitsanulokensis]|uniref:Mutator family transposase n=1 Tax=Planotetraspora phitsanulokensis TaxID=575192 RepID=A0A8J3XHB9_9ACTN|nr:transposase [Planotetraspora phitsanulokensis]GII41074.1 hypothetical protein Pph01_60770 [Planotetraspora phitsanulokensis]
MVLSERCARSGLLIIPSAVDPPEGEAGQGQEVKVERPTGLWRTCWEQFTPFLAFPPEIRKVIYTTNAIESLNSRFRQATRRRGHFPTEQAALKVLYLVIRNPRPNRSNVTGKTSDWKAALNALTLYYGDRITIN